MPRFDLLDEFTSVYVPKRQSGPRYQSSVYRPASRLRRLPGPAALIAVAIFLSIVVSLT